MAKIHFTKNRKNRKFSENRKIQPHVPFKGTTAGDISRPVGTAEPPRRFRGSHSNRRQPVPSEKLPKITKNNFQMTITRPPPGLRSSSWVYPIQVNHPGAHGTIPDRIRPTLDDFLINILSFLRINDFNLIRPHSHSPRPHKRKQAEKICDSILQLCYITIHIWIRLAKLTK